jgi:lipoprotein NlpD
MLCIQRRKPFVTCLSLVALAVLAGCANTRNSAPVVERSVGGKPVAAGPSGAAIEASTRPAAGAENAGKPGYYTVKPGDTLIRIGLDNGQNWRDIARWNGIENANLIEVGQTLRVVPPGTDAAVASSRPVALAKADARPLTAPPAAGASGVPAPLAASAPSAAVAGREGDDDVNWMWPSAGAIAGNFEEGRSKGLAILGKAGDPVYAAADGRVVYAGSGLRGYGNLVIVKHNATYLTAYAHNQTLLVKEDQAVRRGQKIAEMGASDAERVQLHFEVRRQGKPIDPMRVMPQR